MIRKAILIFFLLLPLVCANTDYSNYKTLDLEMGISGDININHLQRNSKVEHLIVNFYFFPRESDRLSIMKMERLSTPEATLTESKEESIMFRWDNPKETELHAGINTLLKSKNDFTKIPAKVRFPLEGLNSALLKYTEETQYVDINPKIADKASELAEGETDLYITVYKIADWVKNNINYDLNTLTEDVVQKSSWVFENKEGVCDEITNLFISMLRSLKIPARFVSGVVYTNAGPNFSNHGWAEVYFPGYGWIPFDVTYGQYGWTDPTHIKLASSFDPSEPSVGYAWRSVNTEVNVEPLDIETKVLGGEKGMIPIVSLEIEPLEGEADLKSYIPLKVTARNLMPYYTPLIVYIKKAPGLTESPVRHSILRPLEQKSLYWIVYLKDKLPDSYIYTYDLEAQSLFGATASNKIKFGRKFNYYSKGWAEETVKKLSEQKEKLFLKEIDFNCSLDDEEYYFNETATVNCTLANKGNINFKNINVCLDKICRKIDLKIAEKAHVDFETVVLNDLELKATAEIADLAKQLVLHADMVKKPAIEINLTPVELGYNEDAVLELTLTSPSNVYDAEIDIEKFKRIHVDKFRVFKVTMPAKGKDLISGLKVSVYYKDKNYGVYTFDKKFEIKVTDVPFHARMLNYIKNAF